MSSSEDSLKACREAFERLKKGDARLEKYAGLAKGDINKSIVSLEAGLDKGYLKSSRMAHIPLILEIESYVSRNAKSKSTPSKRVSRFKKQAAAAKSEKEQLEEVLNNVLSDNIRLVERVRVLERKLAEYESGKVVSISKNESPL